MVHEMGRPSAGNMSKPRLNAVAFCSLLMVRARGDLRRASSGRQGGCEWRELTYRSERTERTGGTDKAHSIE